MRFKRDFELIIGLGTQAIIVRPPMRIAFDVQKSIPGFGLNKLNLQIYNLKNENRLKIAKDKEDNSKYIPLSLSVGYKDSRDSIFKGSVHWGKNSRAGAELITSIESLDGGFDFLNSFTSKTVRGKENAITEILKDMPNTGRGKITSQRQLIRPKVLVGNSIELIQQQINDDESWFIDNEKLYIIKNGEIVSTYLPVVSAKTGLLNTPERENQKISFETLINPSVRIGGLVKLESVTAPYLNDTYKVGSIGYKGDNYGSNWSQAITGIKGVFSAI